MAYIIPSDITRIALAGGHTAELATLAQLRDGLPGDYTVFHGVHWSNNYDARSRFGEIDFVVLNRSGDVLLIEQKNGPLLETDDGLVKAYGDARKNVVELLHRSFDAMREKFRRQNAGAGTLQLDYLVYCPDHRVENLNAAGLDASRVVDARADVTARIAELLGPGVASGHRQKVHDFFAQRFDLVPDAGAHIEHQQRGFVRHVGGLAELFRNLEMSPYRLRVHGTAGCGKSLLARRFFEREIDAGRRPLLLCFNRPLAEAFRESVGEGGFVSTFHGFCHMFLEACGIELDFAGMTSDRGFWRRVQEQVIAQVVADDWLFDALIVDEGQDFEAEWWDIAQLFLIDDAAVLWLEDQDQNLFDKTPLKLDGFVGYRAEINYRSPARIASFIERHLPFSFHAGNALPGQGVTAHGYDDPTEQPALVERVLADLMRAGFAGEDVALITCQSLRNSVFDNMSGVGSTSLRRFTGAYADDGRQIMTQGQVLFDSIRRFKGQDAPAVILTDIDPDPNKLPHWERLLYCGMTRATVRLELLVRRGGALADGLLRN